MTKDIPVGWAHAIQQEAQGEDFLTLLANLSCLVEGTKVHQWGPWTQNLQEYDCTEPL